MLAGDENVGKSSLIRRFVDEHFSESYIPTLGFQIYAKKLEIGKYSVALQIWDVAGQGSFEFARKTYYPHSQGFLLVFDLTNPTSFQNLDRWVAEIRGVCPNIPFVLVGNKSDLTRAIISPEEVAKKSKKLKASCNILTSAMKGVKVNEAFDLLGRAMLAAQHFVL
ncbi:MAG: small GTP-binding protein [Promethearchaeota archaeon CR_4]|nr:MAG: small GTP-binding protein [Candidatus Lokiarchaeota archaeon CR_4]